MLMSVSGQTNTNRTVSAISDHGDHGEGLSNTKLHITLNIVNLHYDLLPGSKNNLTSPMHKKLSNRLLNVSVRCKIPVSSTQ